METIYHQRMTADMDGEFVVLLIGMRVNKLWKVHKWLPVAFAMGKMIQELYAHPELGFMGHHAWMGRTTIMVQYWRSFQQLSDYAKQASSHHLPAWRRFNETVGSSGDVGIWHETYRSATGLYECIYHNMPRFGLAKVGKHGPAEGLLKSAYGRMYREKQETGSKTHNT